MFAPACYEVSFFAPRPTRKSETAQFEYLSIYHSVIARKVNVGALVVAISQIFPLAQIYVGLFSFHVAVFLNLAVDGDDLGLSSELGGFVTTFLTGGILIVGAGLVGQFLSWLLQNNGYLPWVTLQEIVMAYGGLQR